MLERQWLVARTIHAFRPDVVASLMGSYTQSARLYGIRNVIFTDTETQAFNHAIAHPFCDEIHTPYCFLKEFGHKHHRYRGLHELSFLHPDRFKPDPEVLKKYEGLQPGRYIIVRMSAWNTFHDRDRSGIGKAIYPFVERFKDTCRIVLSAEEGKVPPGLEQYAIRFVPEDFHHLLGHARFVLTEGASTASEAACLGVPSVFINSVGELGNFKVLDGKYRLVRFFRDPDQGMPSAAAWLEELLVREDTGFTARHRQLIQDHVDVCGYVFGFFAEKCGTT
jgi:predicted glycosyltransferase